MPTDEADLSSITVRPMTQQLAAGAPQTQYNQQPVGSVANDLSGQQMHTDAYQVSGTAAASSAPVPYSQQHPQHAADVFAPQPSSPQQDGNPQSPPLKGGLQPAGSSDEKGPQSLPLVNGTPQGLVSGVIDRPPPPQQATPEKLVDQNGSTGQDTLGGLEDTA